MSEPSLGVDQDKYTELVHDALNKLYDSVALQRHPLGLLLDPRQDNPVQRSQNLRRALLAGLQSLRPAPNTPASSPDWRAYHLLELRYIEGLDPAEVMAQLGLAKSQYYREQSRVIDSVAAALQAHIHTAPPAPLPAVPVGVGRQSLIRAEAERLSAYGARAAVDDVELLAELAAIADRLAKDRGVHANLISMHAIRGLVADRVLLRQAVLAALNSALNVPGVRSLSLDSFSDDETRGLLLRASPADAAELPADQVEMCRSLVEAVEGAFSISRAADAVEFRIAWRAAPKRTLLVIDDNEGLVELFRRYLAGYPWRVLGANDGLEAREVIAERRPDLIILDVMMPKEDGWEFLMAVKTSEGLRDIPIVMCSVLNQPQIALALGATAHLPKPVTQQALLDTLARCPA